MIPSPFINLSLKAGAIDESFPFINLSLKAGVIDDSFPVY
jgi:hypothetical protein